MLTLKSSQIFLNWINGVFSSCFFRCGRVPDSWQVFPIVPEPARNLQMRLPVGLHQGHPRQDQMQVTKTLIFLPFISLFHQYHSNVLIRKSKQKHSAWDFHTSLSFLFYICTIKLTKNAKLISCEHHYFFVIFILRNSLLLPTLASQ